MSKSTKIRITSALQILVLLLFYSCGDEQNPSPSKGKITFSPSAAIRSNGRISQAATPAFVLFSIKAGNGEAQENIKLTLFSLGQSYISENLELQKGNYQLTQFVVFDAAEKIIYATPLEGSVLAKYVTDPLPFEFTITNEVTQVAPQVLAVEPTDNPELFGYVSFGFDIIRTTASLNIHLQYPDLGTYDSAIIVFKNSTSIVKQKLTLDNTSHIATGHVSIPFGDWNISTSYFLTIVKDYESLEKNGVVNLQVSSTATDLISDEAHVFVEDNSDPIAIKSFNWIDYYYYQLRLLIKNVNTVEGFVRLPKDPANPFIEIATFKPKWIYAYADRSFYNSSLDGTRNHFQGGDAFELYGTSGDTHDRLDKDIIDTTSLAPGISEVSGEVWNFVDCLIIVEGIDSDHELLIYHEWDLRTSSGRISSTSNEATWSKTNVDKRKRINLN